MLSLCGFSFSFAIFWICGDSFGCDTVLSVIESFETKRYCNLLTSVDIVWGQNQLKRKCSNRVSICYSRLNFRVVCLLDNYPIFLKPLWISLEINWWVIYLKLRLCHSPNQLKMLATEVLSHLTALKLGVLYEHRSENQQLWMKWDRENLKWKNFTEFFWVTICMKFTANG